MDRAAELRVTLTSHMQLDAAYRLEVPAWIEVEEDPVWTVRLAPDEQAERTWRLTATRAGFWRASLSEEGAPVGGCCFFAWSTADRGIWSREAANALPAESSVGFHPSFAAADAERAELTLRVSPQDRRYAGQEIFMQVLGDPASEQRAPADGPHDFRHVFALAEGASRVITPSASIRVTFEGGEASGEPIVAGQSVACANIQVERRAGEVAETSRWSCEASPVRPGRPIPGAGVAGPIIAVALALALASAPARGAGLGSTRGAAMRGPATRKHHPRRPV